MFKIFLQKDFNNWNSLALWNHHKRLILINYILRKFRMIKLKLLKFGTGSANQELSNWMFLTNSLTYKNYIKQDQHLLTG